MTLARGQVPGQGRRARCGRPPRPLASSLTSPPVGAPSVAVLPEIPARRHDRDRDRPGPQGPQGPRSSEPRPQTPGSPPPELRLGPPETASAVARFRTATGPWRPRPPWAIPGPNAGRPPGAKTRSRTPPTARRTARRRAAAPPPPPLSKEALQGDVPLGTFGCAQATLGSSH